MARARSKPADEPERKAARNVYLLAGWRETTGFDHGVPTMPLKADVALSGKQLPENAGGL
jgi:hypothetical protein